MPQNIQETSNQKVQTFGKKMVKDVNETYLEDGMWLNAINAVNDQTGVLSSEPANRFVTRVPYTLIGSIPMLGDQWVLFSTDDIDSEIGVFDDSEGTYRKVVNDKGLGLKRTHLITGACKKNFDCSFSVYFADGLNPDRTLNLSNVPYKKKDTKKKKDDCYVPEYTTELDVEALRIAKMVKSPALRLSKSTSGGNLLNGSYQAVIAYTVNGIRVTDYFPPSNAQSIFDHRNMSGAVELEILECDNNFEEFELVMISFVNQQATARRLGIYSTRQKVIMIDIIKESLPIIPLDNIPVQTPAYDKSDAIYEVNDYLIRTGVYTKPEINWQPLVNKIVTKWVAVEVPADYYIKGGNLAGHMRDEVYAYFIRGVYNTGERTSCYPVIGRKADGNDLSVAGGQDVFEMQLPDKPEKPLRKFQVENTATITSTQSYKIPEGNVIAEGLMGYHESTEIYPDDKPEVWGDNCGKPIRHHRMPDNDLVPNTNISSTKIVILAVKFENIMAPLDNQGNPITSIVGYEILRASREGNKTIIAKGMLNNTGEYDLPEDNPQQKGLYPNFPYNDVRPNPFLSKNLVKGGCQGKGFKPLDSFRKDVFTFHSPETQFRNPFLNATELKIHGELSGNVIGQYDPVYKHPKHKLLRDLALVVSGLVGVGEGMVAIRGKKTTTTVSPRNQYVNILKTTATDGGTVMNNPVGAIVGNINNAVREGIKLGLEELLKTIPMATATTEAIRSALKGYNKLNERSMPTSGNGLGGETRETTESTAFSELPLVAKLAGGTFMFTYFFAQGTEEALRVIRNLIPHQQYAYQYNSHAFYDRFTKSRAGNRRRHINNSSYLEPYLQNFAGKYRVNNLFRGRQVLLELNKDLDFTQNQDNTRATIGDLRQWDNPSKSFQTKTAAYYASLKVPMKAQYGQVDSCLLIPVSTQVHPLTPSKDQKFTSPVLFGGDTYINRYSEKNSFFLFNEWMHDMPDDTEWDYNMYSNIPYPRYWINTTKYETTNLTSSLIRFNFKDNVLPNDFAALDRPASDCKTKVSFVINKAFFYTFVNGVRDFFVESEYNLAQRDWGERIDERHYDAGNFTDLKTLFRSDIIKSGNHFKYDLSLSVSRMVHNFISWGRVLPRDFDPKIEEKCYQYYEKRAIYSLPQQEELKKDNWTSFLANNYKDFSSKITAIQSAGQTGAIIFFPDRSPVQFMGVDQLQTDAGIKLTIGDGGLFQQPLSSVSNADKYYEYGSCQDRMSIMNTPAGLFWISMQQGKIFHFTEGMNAISNNGLRVWFSDHLKSKLLADFPGFELSSNPVMGIGCMAIYDPTRDIAYFLKKDYKLRDEYKGKLTYLKDNIFLLRGRSRVLLGDPTYFEDASFTISYDPKNQGWISYHNWKPDFVLPSSVNFYTATGGSLWKHNDRSDLFCNFYGVDYPFEVEFPITTGQDEMTLRSLEYILECRKFYNQDSHHLLDFNFDRAMIYNSEQHSGLLKLFPKPKNNPYASLDNPAVSLNSVDTYYSKTGNKYRLNEFFDLTRTRSEFDEQYIPMWETSANGFQKQINNRYISYSKSPLQRKRFRHYSNYVILRRTKLGDVKMSLKFVNSKHLKSFS
jgi:hypothetical protein